MPALAHVDVVGTYVGFVPGVALSAVLAVAGSRSVAGWLGTRRVVAGLFILSVGVILAATLTPGREALEHASDIGGRCDLGRLTPASPREYLRFGSAGLNVLLFMPLGFVVALLPRSRRTAGIAIAAIALPFTVEGVQLLATFLGRACQSADVVDNLLGLAGGAVLGAAAVITGLISGHREIGAGRRHSGQ